MTIIFVGQLVFLFCVSYAVISDFRQSIIPNWIPLSLVAVFAVVAPFALELDTILAHVGLAALVFFLTAAFYSLGWIAGGDVKLMTAVVLWMGPGVAAPFALIMAVIGGIFALTLMALKRYDFLVANYVPKNWLTDRMISLASAGEVPYGVAIGIAALIVSGDLLMS